MRRQQALFNINFSFLVTIVALLPLLGALTCIILSILFNFKESTWTHCRVPNYLPSISSAIGGYAPQKYIWRICIALHAAPRFLFAFSYFGYYTSFHVGSRNTLYTILARICVFLHVVENSALVILTYVSSTDNYAVHENMFIAFMVCSEVYMLLSCILFKWSHTSNGRIMTKPELRSYQYKKRLFVFNVSMFLMAVYLFFRHDWYCETGVYSLFALCEYLVVFSNIAFHYTAKFDFSDQQVLLAGEESGEHPKQMVLSLHPV
uniref:Post-GPI attachment to proteins factor 2-like n=1 Tax=Crassostrea virginica TaxID=6565 RepID=A0A8B8D128_CRAVI|nr:post-GPI attachment to proteins factor 2-like [Crassostrea virginica]